jgi:hypothetical protein
MIALSVVNFGMLSIWLNSTVTILVILYHTVFLAVVVIYRKSFTSASADPPVVKQHKKGADSDESFDYFDRAPIKPLSIAFKKWNIAALFFLFATNLVAFGTMVNVTTLGAVSGTLPPERLGSHKWDITIQIAQTTVFGCQLLTIGVLLGISAWGRRCIILEEENRSQEAQYVV